MDTKELLNDFMKKFRLNCHYRFMFMPPEVEEIPFHIYEAAYKEAKDELKGALVNTDEITMVDNLYKSFVSKIKDTKDYNIADEMVVEEINNGYSFENVVEEK